MEKKKPGIDFQGVLDAPDDRRPHQARRRARSRKILKSKPEYVVNTSEFNDVKGRLNALHNRRKVGSEGRLEPSAPAPRAGQRRPIDEDDDDKKQKPDQDERPTLKRRDN